MSQLFKKSSDLCRRFGTSLVFFKNYNEKYVEKATWKEKKTKFAE